MSFYELLSRCNIWKNDAIKYFRTLPNTFLTSTNKLTCQYTSETNVYLKLGNDNGDIYFACLILKRYIKMYIIACSGIKLSHPKRHDYTFPINSFGDIFLHRNFLIYLLLMILLTKNNWFTLRTSADSIECDRLELNSIKVMFFLYIRFQKSFQIETKWIGPKPLLDPSR